MCIGWRYANSKFKISQIQITLNLLRSMKTKALLEFTSLLKLERWHSSSWEHMRLFRGLRFQFPALKSGNSQPPVTPAPRIHFGYIWAHTGTHAHTHTHRQGEGETTFLGSFIRLASYAPWFKQQKQTARNWYSGGVYINSYLSLPLSPPLPSKG